MNFWLGLVAYQVVWFAAVSGASRGSAWPGVLGMLIYAAVQLALAKRYRVDLALLASGWVFGLVIDGTLIRCDLATYAAGWPNSAVTPAWILALWGTFALTFSQSLRYLQSHLALASLLGLIGGPMAYWGASRGWKVVDFPEPEWRGFAALSAAWALATPALAWLARHLMERAQPVAGQEQSP